MQYSIHSRFSRHSMRIFQRIYASGVEKIMDETYPCYVCGMVFHQIALLAFHMETHKTEQHYHFHKNTFDINIENCDSKFTNINIENNADNIEDNADKYTCTQCEETFDMEDSLITHMRKHTGEKPYTCGECGKTFSLKNNLLRHTRTHTGEGMYSCNLCNKQYANKRALLGHHSKSHFYETLSKTTNLETHITKHPVKEATGLDIPVKSHFGKEHFPVSRSIVECVENPSQSSNLVSPMSKQNTEIFHQTERLCNQTFSQTTDLEIHNTSNIGEVTNNQKNCMNKSTTECLCKICGKSCPSNFALDIHMRSHTGEKPYPCSYCNKTFASKSNLTRHLMTHPEEENTNLKRHMNKSNKVYLCNLCGKSCPSQFILDVHIRSHTGEKPFPCSLCNTSFATKSNLTRHIMTHSGEKPFQCDNCDKVYASKAQLEIHQASHTGEKSYECIHCDRTYSHYKQLKSHLKTSHQQDKLYECDQCDMAFKMEKILKRHMRVHTTEKLFQCNLCGKSFKWNHVLKTHMKVHNRQNQISL